MRLMVTYYDGNDMRIADVHYDGDPQLLTPSQVADDCENINAVVEVLPGIDYDKQLYAATTGGSYPVMLLA